MSVALAIGIGLIVGGVIVPIIVNAIWGRWGK